MYVLADGSSGFLIKDIKNKTRIRFNLDKEENSNFEILDSKERAKIKGSVSSDGKVKLIK